MQVHEIWKEQGGRRVLCIDPAFLSRILSDGYITCEATGEMIAYHLVSEDCRVLAIPREWVREADPGGDLIDSAMHWRPGAA